MGSPLVDTAAGRQFQKIRAGRILMGKTLPEAVYSRPLLEWRGKQEVGVIAGTVAVGLGRIIERLPRPNDGMVSLAETALPGITAHCSLRLSHTGLVLSSDAVEEVSNFLRDGRFSH